jgi:hypothetical protein
MAQASLKRLAIARGRTLIQSVVAVVLSLLSSSFLVTNIISHVNENAIA